MDLNKRNKAADFYADVPTGQYDDLAEDALRNHVLWVEVCYVIATGGSGCTRMMLNEVPRWLTDNGAPRLIHEIRVIA